MSSTVVPRTSVPELHGPTLAYPLGGQVDALVARWAKTDPDAPALCWRDREISYGELVDRSRSVAGWLRARGVRPGQRVAVRLPRGPELVEALLGVLMCGAAYAGVSVDWPRQRFDRAVALTGAVLAITEERQVVEAGPALDDRDADGGPADPCCVFFTSGSSGQPRAVLSPHWGTSRVALDPYLDFGRDTRMLQVSPLGWDAMSLELWCPLINGGVSVLYDGTHPTAPDVRSAVRRGVNTVFLTGSLFNALVDEDVAALAGVRHVLTGGERISGHHVAAFRAAHPGIRLSNLYGPVEASIYATAYDIPERVDEAEQPIGRPVPNTSVYLVDGMMAIGGDGLAVEYLGDPEATADRFRRLPLGPEGAPVRVYLTGDLAELDGAGRLRFLGRRDRQFKLRGVRIEPEEVETAMEQVPGVSRGVLLPLPLGTAAKTESVGFVLGSAAEEEVRAHLAATLPAAFVPGRVIKVRYLPTNANGKLDTTCLAQWAKARRPSPARDTGSAGADVQAICAAAGDLLAATVGPDDDLFDLGADSLTVIRLASRLPVSAAAVLHGRTPRRIAAAGGPTSSPARPGRSGRWVGNLPISQYRMWYLEQRFPGAPDAIQTLLFRVRGRLDVAVLTGAVEAVVHRHDALRTLLGSADGKYVDPQVRPAGDVLEVCEYTPEAVDEYLVRPFDLARDRPMRTALFRCGADEHLLAIAVHHAAFDGWSEGILCRDLSAAYAGVALPVAPAFREVARSQVDRAGGEDDYWIEHLRGVPEIPLGVRPGAEPGPLARVPVRLDLVDPDALQRVCGSLAVTPSAVYLAAWIRALRAETGAGDFAVGMPLAGRTVAEAEDVIGCFTSSAVLRFPAAVSDADAVRHASGLLERLMSDPYVPLERAYWQLRPADTGRNPFCQVGFVLQNNDHDRLVLPGLAVERVPVPQRGSVFELALMLWPGTPATSHVWYRTDVVAAERAERLAGRWLAEMRDLVPATSSPRPGVDTMAG